MSNFPFNADATILATIAAIADMPRGGIATIYGYRPTSGYVTPPTFDEQVIMGFNTDRLYKRKLEALNKIEFADVADAIANNPKLAALDSADALELFNARKAQEVASLTKTLEGDRDDAMRQAHDRCYASVGQGAKVHFVTEKVNGVTVPVLTNGKPTAESVQIAVLSISRRYTDEGVSKPAPNSGASVLMKNAIESVLNQRSVGYSSRKLVAGTFDRIAAGGAVVTAQELTGKSAVITSIILESVAE